MATTNVRLLQRHKRKEKHNIFETILLSRFILSTGVKCISLDCTACETLHCEISVSRECTAQQSQGRGPRRKLNILTGEGFCNSSVTHQEDSEAGDIVGKSTAIRFPVVCCKHVVHPALAAANELPTRPAWWSRRASGEQLALHFLASKNSNFLTSKRYVHDEVTL